MQPSAQIVHISTVRPPLEVIVFHQFCQSLVEAGYRVHLIVHNGDDDETRDGVHIRTIGHRRRGRGLVAWSRLMAILRAARRARDTSPEAFYIHDPELIPLGLWLKFTTKAKIVYDSQEDYTAYMKQKYFIPAPIRWVLTRLMATSETAAARCLDAVITSDEGTARIFRRRGSKRVVVLHNFPKIELFSDAPFFQVDKRYDLVYHGSIPKYHLEAAFDVASELKRRGRDARWLFFGTCHDVKWAHERIRDLGLEGCFDIKGRVPHEEVAPLVAEAKIGFIPLPDLPKFRHNIPMKLFEFMALRMPTVLTDLPPSRPFVGDGKCAIMVPPGNAVEFANAIERLLDNPQLCEEMGKEGRRRIESEYNWKTESQKLVSLQHELIS